MEIKITTDLATIPQIDFNFAELKKDIADALVKYNGIVYTDDSIKDAKGDRAKLRAFKDAIDTKRKEVKKQCLAPYEEFNSKIDELYKLIDSPISAIDGQVKAYEDKQKSEKRIAITTYFNSVIGELASFLPLEKIWSEKWLNAGEKLKSIEAEILATIEQVKADLAVITGLKSEFELQVKDRYLQTLNLSSALAEGTRLEGQKIKQAEYDKQQEQAKVEAVIEPVKPIEQPTLQPQDCIDKAFEGDLEILDFRVWVTPEQKQALKTFLTETKIKYGRVE